MTGAKKPNTASVLCLSAGGFHRMVYRQWGADSARRAVICVHGLARNSGDFADLAPTLVQAGYRVVAPDVVGRGDSDYLYDPTGYSYPQYLADMTALIARLGMAEVDWIGTSMGGLIGMMLAAQPKTPIRRLVVNDVGPFIPKDELERILGYLGAEPKFEDLRTAEIYLRVTYAQFGPLTDAQWQRMAAGSTRRAGSALRLAYDPAIAVPFKQLPLEDVDLWPVWERIACPVLVLRGADSQLLRPETAAEMGKRGPGCRLIEFQGCGHAPSLMATDQIAAVRDWLSDG